MLKSLLEEINLVYNKNIALYSSLNPWTNIYGISRSILAFGLLLTILISKNSSIYYDSSASGNLIMPSNIQNIGLFNIFIDNLLLAQVIAVIVLLWVISGFLPQLSCFFQWWVTFSFMISSPTIEGGDQINNILCLLLIPVCVLDNRKNHWHRKKNVFAPKRKLLCWSCYFIIILQISIIYFHACIAKLAVPEWLNGTAVYYWATHNIFGVNNALKDTMIYLLSYSIFVILATWGTILLELLLFSWIFMKRNTWNWKILLLIGILFHFMIVFFHGLVSFFLAMLGALILYLVPKELEIKFRS